MLPHANPIEYVFVIVSLGGLIFSIWRFLFTLRLFNRLRYEQLSQIEANIAEVFKSQADAAQVGDLIEETKVLKKEVQATVQTDIRREFFLGLVHTIMAVTAISFLFLAPPPPNYSEVPQSRFGILMWIATSFFLSLKSVVVEWSKTQEEQFYDLKIRPDRRKR